MEFSTEAVPDVKTFNYRTTSTSHDGGRNGFSNKNWTNLEHLDLSCCREISSARCSPHNIEGLIEMRSRGFSHAYHVERALAARQGIERYPCGCELCHGFKTQPLRIVESHHRRYGRDKNLTEPLLRNLNSIAEHEEDPLPSRETDGEDHLPSRETDGEDHLPSDETDGEDLNRSVADIVAEEDFVDAEDYLQFEGVPPNTDVNFDEVIGNYFGRADEIHGQRTAEEDTCLDFEDLSSGEEEEADWSPIVEDLLRQSAEPLYHGSSTSRLQFSIILMSLCTLFSVSHHCLDEILTFLKYDVLPADNQCPKDSHEMKTMLMKLGLSHEAIHCCDCGQTLYWKENANLQECPKCKKSRYIQGSTTVPVRVLRYFSLIQRLRRMFRCPDIAKHLRWHSSNHSEDNKMRSAVDSEQWRFIAEKYPSFNESPRNIRMGLSLDGVNPHSLHSSKHSVWPVMMVLYNLPPYLVTKRFFICLTMIIPGPNSPSEETIDIYLQPLVHELKKLWKGVPATDMSEPPGPNRSFTMRGMLLWTINDFPAYTLISGQAGKGYAGCPVCGEGTFAEHSSVVNKTVFLGNRRWLRHNHRWRAARAAFNGQPNHDPPPPRQSGLSVVQRGGWRESYLKCGGRPNSKDDPVKKTGVKRISVLFQLPYWQELPIRHTLDPMHCEKNVCENVLRTFFGENDGAKSREDLRARDIRHHLHLQPNADGQTYFMPDAPYVLTKDEREAFLKTLRELKFPSNYVGALSSRIHEGKLRGLKTHDFHILLEQVIPLCLRNVGDPKVVGAVMRLSRLFRKICAKIVDAGQKEQMLEDVAETVCSLEKELPPSVFVIMMHLPIHLAEEMFICGPVHTRWMYPFERYMKGLKGFVKNKAKPEGSMAHAYLREESIGFLNEYLSEYTATRKRAWDPDEEPAMYDEILEGVKRDRVMSPEFQKLIHGFVLDNVEPIEPYRRRYAEAVLERDFQRNEYRRMQRRGGRRSRFAYPRELRQLPDFAEWILEEVRREQQAGVSIDPAVVDTSRGPLPLASAYKSMYAFGNHYRVLSCEQALKTADSGVAATFKQVCRNGRRDANEVNADVEYVGHIEEILELNYRRHCLVVLVCDFVKANYAGENATIKKDKWGFTLANYERRYGSVGRDSFAFPSHCEQVYYANATEAPGWKVVMRKEVRGRRVLPSNEVETEPALFEMGQDEDFEGVRPEREVGEDHVPAAATGQDVVLLPVVRGRRNRGRGTRGGVNRRGRGQAGRRGRGSLDTRQRNLRVDEPFSEEEDDSDDEEMLYRNYDDLESGGHRGGRRGRGSHASRRVRRRFESQSDFCSNDDNNPDLSAMNRSGSSTSDSSGQELESEENANNSQELSE